jgi:hypothetical protein
MIIDQCKKHLHSSKHHALCVSFALCKTNKESVCLDSYVVDCSPDPSHESYFHENETLT